MKSVKITTSLTTLGVDSSRLLDIWAKRNCPSYAGFDITMFEIEKITFHYKFFNESDATYFSLTWA